MRTFRLRWQLAAGMALVALVLMCAATIILASRSDDLRRTEAVVGAQRDAELLAAQVTPRLLAGRPIAGLLTTTANRRMEVVDANGRLLAGDDVTSDVRISDAIAAVLDGIDTSTTVTPLDDGRDGVVVGRQVLGIHPVLVDDELRAVVVVGEDMPDRHGWRQLYGLDPLAAGALSVAAAGLGWWLAGRITRPLRRLTDQARTMVLGGRGEVVAGTSRIGEVAVLGTAIRDIAVRIDRERDRRDRVDADLRRLSHEMRTPLTTMRLRLEDLAEDLTGDTTGTSVDDHLVGPIAAASIVDTMRIVSGQLDRLGRLGDQISQLRLDRVEAEMVDLATVTALVVVRLRPLATWGRVDLQLDAQRWAMALVEPDAVEDAIANVVGNAVKYVPRGGHVHVRVFATADGFTVEVRDDGPGIAASMREVIVRPGVRVTSGCGVDGTGQGLAIVAATMDRSGGHLELDDAPGRGAIVRLVFPSATVSPEDPIACDDQHTDLADSLPLVHQ